MASGLRFKNWLQMGARPAETTESDPGLTANSAGEEVSAVSAGEEVTSTSADGDATPRCTTTADQKNDQGPHGDPTDPTEDKKEDKMKDTTEVQDAGDGCSETCAFKANDPPGRLFADL